MWWLPHSKKVTICWLGPLCVEFACSACLCGFSLVTLISFCHLKACMITPVTQRPRYRQPQVIRVKCVLLNYMANGWWRLVFFWLLWLLVNCCGHLSFANKIATCLQTLTQTTQQTIWNMFKYFESECSPFLVCISFSSFTTTWQIVCKCLQTSHYPPCRHFKTMVEISKRLLVQLLLCDQFYLATAINLH